MGIHWRCQLEWRSCHLSVNICILSEVQMTVKGLSGVFVLKVQLRVDLRNTDSILSKQSEKKTKAQRRSSLEAEM